MAIDTYITRNTGDHRTENAEMFDIDINTKFKVGQNVFFIQYDVTHKKCKICLGNQKVIIKNRKFNCPCCNGSGLKPDGTKLTYSILERNITEIQTIIWTSPLKPKIKLMVCYSINDCQHHVKEIYHTKEEAQKRIGELEECQRLKLLSKKLAKSKNTQMQIV